MDKNRDELISTAVHRMMSVMRYVRHHGPPPEPRLSPPQIHLLFTITAEQEGISAKELAERSSITPGAVTQFVDGLVEKGLVAREGDLNDRRVVRLKVTKLALQQMEKMRKEHLSVMSKVFEGLSNDEIKQLIDLYTKINTYHEMKEKTHVKTVETP
jgi:DNA-binding MarR family transcriptional regulator